MDLFIVYLLNYSDIYKLVRAHYSLMKNGFLV